MKNRRYVLVIMDTSGSATRRVTVSLRMLRLVGLAATVLVLTALGAAVHAVSSYPVAQETRALLKENAELSSALETLAGSMPYARTQHLQARMGWAQLKAKSGMGIPTRQFGMGPLAASSTIGAGPVATGGHHSDVGDGMKEAANLRQVAVPPTQTLSQVVQLTHADTLLALPGRMQRQTQLTATLRQYLGETLEYFHDAERLLSNTPSIRPARTPWLTSSFGKRRDPMHGRWVMHKGLDMGGYLGMEIIAPADGVVIWTGRRGGYGRVVVLDHGYGLQTHYAHLSRYHVKIGDRVQRGDPIADMGSTGKSTGPHLHYEVRRHGRPLDPRSFILD